MAYRVVLTTILDHRGLTFKNESVFNKLTQNPICQRFRMLALDYIPEHFQIPF